MTQLRFRKETMCLQTRPQSWEYSENLLQSSHRLRSRNQKTVVGRGRSVQEQSI